MMREGAPDQPSRQELRDAVRNLPLTGETPTLDDQSISAARGDMGRYNPHLLAGLSGQLERLHEEDMADLQRCRQPDGAYLLSERSLRAILARGINAGGAQIAYSLGAASLDIARLERAIDEPDENGGGAIRPPAV